MFRRLSTQWIVVILLCNSFNVTGQMNSAREAVLKAILENDRILKDEIFKVPSQSPLNKSQIYGFTGLNYFQPDMKYRVAAKLIPSESPDTVKLPMSNGASKEFIRYGTVRFLFEGENYSLAVFMNKNLPELKDKPGVLVIPFFDCTTGKQTNNNGRYVTIRPPAKEEDLSLDFNRSLNPYSAYNVRIPSMIPPSENVLPIHIYAGEKKFLR